MPAWNPSLPWPGSPGGAWSPHWGEYVRLYVRAAIAAGRTFHLGAHANDRLDAGNVLGAAAVGRTVTERLWVDLTCDVLSVELQAGASGGAGIFTKPDAATCDVTLADPNGIYDPVNADGPWTYGGRSRLVPGVPVEVYAEVVNATTGAVTTHYLFTGTADSWGEDWTPQPARRRARLMASDATKIWARYDRPEQPPIGAGDTTAQRIQRLATYYGWPGVIEAAPSSTVTLQATTLAAPGWELIGRTMDDELGVAYFTTRGALRWTNRAAWFADTPPVVELGCGAGLHDVLVDASPSAFDLTLKNTIHAARTGGVSQSVASSASVAQFGVYEYSRTDLGLETDAQAALWAADVLIVAAYPHTRLENVAMLPAISPQSWIVWPQVLDVKWITDQVRVVWTPPDRPDAGTVDANVRVVGTSHRISRASWEVSWELAGANALGGASIFTLGTHANDRLDAGNVLALA